MKRKMLSVRSETIQTSRLAGGPNVTLCVECLLNRYQKSSVELYCQTAIRIVGND
jgi:hypothetical protein